MDRVVTLPCRTDGERQTSETGVFTMFIYRTEDLPDCLQTIRNMIESK